mgnify:CR=1 FL=1
MSHEKETKQTPAAETKAPETEAKAPEQETPKAEKPEAKHEGKHHNETAALQAKLDEAEKKNEELKNQLLRTAAEYDNYRKRMVKEKEECAKFANQRLLEELLPVIDNFEMGMAAASADASSMIYIGMSMVKKQLDEFLAGNGVSAVEPVVGSMFDHATEEALQREPSDQPEGTVLRVIRKGYMLKDRLLRPANVVVAHTPEPEPQV